MVGAKQNYRSMFSFMRGIVQKEGITALYRGVLYPFCGFGVIFSVAFGVNGTCQDILIGHKMRLLKKQNSENKIILNSSHLSMSELMICGAFAGAASSTVRTPIERVKVWSQIHHTSTLRSTIDLLKRYGFFRGLMFGGWPTISREVPQFAVYYPIYEMVCSLLTAGSKDKKSNVSGTVIYLSGASAGVGCWIVTYPIDIVKTRLQASPPGTYTGMLDCAKQTFLGNSKTNGGIGRPAGLKILFNGLVPTIYRAAILHSAVFLLYERVLDYLEDLHHVDN